MPQPAADFDQLGFPRPAQRDQAAWARWEASAERRQLQEAVAAVGGWADYLWPKQLPPAGEAESDGAACDWEGCGDPSYYSGLQHVTKHKTVLARCGHGTLRAFRDIERDLHRTCPGHAAEQQVLSSCSSVLHAYAVRNPDVGYCQGMNRLAALLTSAMPEERAFWTLALVVERVVPDYYKGLQGAVVDLRLLECMVAQLEPLLWQHLQGIGFSCSVVFTQTLVCLFAACLPPESTLVLWRGIFAHGAPRLRLLRLTCSLISLLKADLLSAQDMPAAVDCFKYHSANLYDAGRLEAVADATDKLLPDAELAVQRAAVADAVLRDTAALRSALVSPGQHPLGSGPRPTPRLLRRIRRECGGSLDGEVTQSEFAVLLARAGAAMDGVDAGQALFRKWDVGSGRAPLRELLVGMALLVDGKLSDRLRCVCDLLSDEPPSGGEGGSPTVSDSPALCGVDALSVGESSGSDRSHGRAEAESPERPKGFDGLSDERFSIDKRAFGLLVSCSSHACSFGGGAGGRGALPSPSARRGPGARGSPRAAAADTMSVADSVFAQLDADGDGRLSVAELSQAVLAVPHLSLALTGLRDARGADSAHRRPERLPNTASATCPLCQKIWRFFRRRHHCRQCGTLACDECSPHRVPLPSLGYHNPVRICNWCHQRMAPTCVTASMAELRTAGQQQRLSSAGRRDDSALSAPAPPSDLGSPPARGFAPRAGAAHSPAAAPANREVVCSDAFLRAQSRQRADSSQSASHNSDCTCSPMLPALTPRAMLDWHPAEPLVALTGVAAAHAVARMRRRLVFARQLRNSVSAVASSEVAAVYSAAPSEASCSPMRGRPAPLECGKEVPPAAVAKPPPVPDSPLCEGLRNAIAQQPEFSEI
eukprot:TRINITY_DN8701_c0_g1_i1.p1 TRINITY_DN8701_c0_g1~~TRINITY_DN8701_c0_g1_i1.p1  ORF type:complete len:878 (+),score=231.95 TRINITY_DN8701_c0_g1_i1:77-2710(+)